MVIIGDNCMKELRIYTSDGNKDRKLSEAETLNSWDKARFAKKRPRLLPESFFTAEDGT